MSHGNLSSTGVRKMSDLVQVAVCVPAPDPVAVRTGTRIRDAVSVPNPEPVPFLGAMCKPTAVSLVVDPPAP